MLNLCEVLVIGGSETIRKQLIDPWAAEFTRRQADAMHDDQRRLEPHGSLIAIRRWHARDIVQPSGLSVDDHFLVQAARVIDQSRFFAMTRSRKSPSRLFVDAALDSSSLALETEQAHYLGRVLRCREGDAIVVFNARGKERSATIQSLGRRRPVIALGASIDPLPEPTTPIILLQALVKSDAMDLIIQKATELGADSVFATRTDFSVVRLDDDRKDRRLGHWRRIAASACEQCGRHRPPSLAICDSLDAAIAALPADFTRIAFDVGSGRPLEANDVTQPGASLAIGPEGGFSPSETELLATEKFAMHSLGPRTLRADTAAIAALTSVQLLIGDLGQPKA